MASLGSRYGAERRCRESEPVPVCRMGSLRRRTDRSAGRGGPLPGRGERNAIRMSFSLHGEPRRRQIANGSGAPSRRRLDDDLLRAVAILAVGPGSSECGGGVGERSRRTDRTRDRSPGSGRPCGRVSCSSRGSADDFSSVGHVAVKWAMRVPALPIAVAVPAGVWDEYLATARGVANQSAPEGRGARGSGH